ncbi:unnamed protein product, partial [Rotaria socialis]
SLSSKFLLITAYGFDISTILSESTDEDVVVQKDMCLDKLDKVLNHLTIGGKVAAGDFVISFY